MTAEFAPAPAPDAAPSRPDVRGAYTAFRRVERRADHGWPGSVTVTETRHDAVDAGLELVEFDRLDARPFAEAVREWTAVDDHDHVAPVVAWGKQPRPWLATVLPAATLADRRGTVDLEEALWLGSRLADALADAHDAGVVHGALAPGRVRLHATSGWAFPRLGGAAVARLIGLSPGRRPPETLDGAAPGPAADVYGLGVVLYEALVGESPYVTDGDPERAVRESTPVPPSAVAPTLPSAVDDLLLDALAKRPADRPAMAALRDRLREGLVAERGDTAGSGGGGAGTGGATGPAGVDTDPPTPASAFPFLDGPRADWRAPCPDCGRAVNNTFASFLAHWRDAPRCTGPPDDPPPRAGHSEAEWAAVVDRVEAARDAHDDAPDVDVDPDHPLWAALAAGDVVAVDGVPVASRDGSHPWLDYAGRGWRVPCPCCDAGVFNTREAMKAHWVDAPDCDGPPDTFDTA